MIGRITTPPANPQEFLKSVEELHIKKRIPILLLKFQATLELLSP
jgi:hypothetical protein